MYWEGINQLKVEVGYLCFMAGFMQTRQGTSLLEVDQTEKNSWRYEMEKTPTMTTRTDHYDKNFYKQTTLDPSNKSI